MMTIAEKKREILSKDTYSVNDFVDVVEILRAPGGCPWDIEQTHTSIRSGLIEETYEVIEAIDKSDPVLLREELGDVLLQVVFHAQIEREAGRFDFGDVVNDVCRKMIHRHPHVFGEVQVANSAEVLSNWEVIKSEEKSRVTVTDKLTAIPRQLPALMRAVKVGKKAKALDFPNAPAVADKVGEELLEVREAMAAGDAAAVEEEIGDLLLSVASLARLCGVDAERALNAATDKFITRFSAVEREVMSRGMEMCDADAATLDEIWENLKKID